ncbi:MAG: DNA/RNA nuclease SfsA [Desulfovibrionales bacterium]|nr:DNA/RNA nuclease SfsA [Desulfovibrionales bacterium]
MRMLNFSPQSCTATFLGREKRFLIHAELRGHPVTVHTNNSGSMLGLLRPGMDIFISPAPSPARKLPYTLELVRPGKDWIGVNTLTPNRLLQKAWTAGMLPELVGYGHFQAEAVRGASRLDACLAGPQGEFWIEAKNVTMVEDQVAAFPDAVTKRGQKHLRELMELARQGARVGVFLAVQRPDGLCFGPADYIDPTFAELFWLAVDHGVEFMPYVVHASPGGIALGHKLPLISRPQE